MIWSLSRKLNGTFSELFLVLFPPDHLYANIPGITPCDYASTAAHRANGLSLLTDGNACTNANPETGYNHTYAEVNRRSRPVLMILLFLNSY
jgi:hypothetical protein